MAWLIGLATFLAGALILGGLWATGRNEYTTAAGIPAKRWRAPRSDSPPRNESPADVDAGFYEVLRRYEVRAEDVAALIVDLAQRGCLRIEQVMKPDARGRGGEWALIRRKVSKEQSATLRSFERSLLNRVFADNTTVRVNSLRRTFGPDYVAVQNEIYRYLVEEKFFRRDPMEAKISWRRAASGLFLGSLLVWIMLRANVEYAGAVALGIFALGVAAAVLSNYVGGRTARGSKAVAEGAAFRDFLRLGTPPLTEAQRAGVFGRYLPYALVFGAAEDWARGCEGLADGRVMAGTGEWFTVPAWTINEVKEVAPREFAAEVEAFYARCAYAIGHSKAAPQRRR